VQIEHGGIRIVAVGWPHDSQSKEARRSGVQRDVLDLGWRKGSRVSLQPAELGSRLSQRERVWRPQPAPCPRGEEGSNLGIEHNVLRAFTRIRTFPLGRVVHGASLDPHKTRVDLVLLRRELTVVNSVHDSS
jgi:hypothetical protein